MKHMTVSSLALAVSLALGGAAFANEGVHKDHDKQAQAQASMQAERSGKQAMKAGANTKAQASTDATLRNARSDQLRKDFATLDADNDGFVRIGDLDPAKREVLSRWDADDDRRLDRYEYDMARTAAFNQLDTDSDSYLSWAELNQVKPATVSFDRFDANEDQRLSKAEYRQFVESGLWARDADRYAFDYMDRDRSGTVSRDEASVYVPVASVFTAHDPDGDGVIERSAYEVLLVELDAEQQRRDAERMAGTQ